MKLSFKSIQSCFISFVIDFVVIKQELKSSQLDYTKHLEGKKTGNS